MKKILLLLVFTLSFVYSAYSQSQYLMKCGVTEFNNCTLEEYECLWGSATKTTKTGIVMTIIGTASLTAGFIVALNEDSGNDFYFWLFAIPIGIVVELIAVPTLITGLTRISRLKKNAHYESLNLSSLRLTPTIDRNHFNNTYSFGLAASLRF